MTHPPFKTSYDGTLFLAENEGVVLCPYKDSVGVYTIGIGHTAYGGWPDPALIKQNITIEQAILLFKADLGPYEDDCNQYITYPGLTQYQFDAACSFHFNTGAIDTANWVDALNEGDLDAAATQIMNWTSPEEVTARRKREQLLFAGADYSEPFQISVWDDYPGSPRSVTIEGGDGPPPPDRPSHCPVCGQPLA